MTSSGRGPVRPNHVIMSDVYGNVEHRGRIEIPMISMLSFSLSSPHFAATMHLSLKGAHNSISRAEASNPAVLYIIFLGVSLVQLLFYMTSCWGVLTLTCKLTMLRIHIKLRSTVIVHLLEYHSTVSRWPVGHCETVLSAIANVVVAVYSLINPWFAALSSTQLDIGSQYEQQSR